ncbi:5562_t:CDS:1 [Gigaspora margarita]|uniref:5562_t:CDS:1 n=1 Tax=Gigaspora margarita TaxID=4874 RepID=A0ABM8W6B8_GIGMA|nr:5562_t:CDS:1 [Gigaspora margarita]
MAQRFQTFPNNPILEEIKLTVNLPPPPPNGKTFVKALTFTASEVKFSYQVQASNRVFRSAESDKFLITDFQKLRFENQSSSEYIIRILTAGIVLNGNRYYYFGQSNSHLKDRKCILLQESQERIKQILDNFGDWSKFKSVAKLAKRIGLLFTTGDKVLDLPSEKYDNIDDIERNNFNFTDGCGFVSKSLIKKIAKKMDLQFRDKRLYPSIIQIRYQGFKGILLLGSHLNGKDKDCEFRKSMNKFNYKGPNDFCVVGYSKPYTFGRLNTQIIMLLSSLGVPDDIFLKKQQQHFERLDLILNDLSIAFEYLLTNGEVKLAGGLIEKGFTKDIRAFLNKSCKQEMETSLKEKKSSSGDTIHSEKLRIIVKDSRIVYAASDPTKKLKSNECFFRPTIENRPQTIIGPIFCVRNPCYHAGDIVVLNAVHIPECEDIVDVLLFSVNGDIPTAHRSAGGDLDGDKFFTCWDKELMPWRTVESYGYPGGSEPVRQNIQRTDLIKHFAKYSNAGVSRCANLFSKWADAKGPSCEECKELNKLFSHAVDGQSVKIPDNLEQTPIVDEHVRQNRIWNRLITIAEVKREEKRQNIATNDLNSLTMDREELHEFLKEGHYDATDYEMLNILIRWCKVNKLEVEEFLYYINFSSFNTYERLSAFKERLIPHHLLFNALNMSRILKPAQMRNFNLDDANHHWKLFHQSNESSLSTSLISNLSKAVTNFNRVFVALRFNHELTICISLHGKFEPDIENDADGKINVYGFNQSGTIMKLKSCLEKYKLYYNEEHFQVYLTKKQNTFVWLGTPKQQMIRVVSLNELDVRSSISVAIDKLCHNTARKTSKIQKKNICESEIYAVSNRDGLHLKYQAVNHEYMVDEEQVDIDVDYNPPNPENPDDQDANLLSLDPINNFTNNLDELIKRMECWTKYGLYDKVIDTYTKFLETINSANDLHILAEFSEKNPIVHIPLVEFVTKPNSLEIQSNTLICLIGTCLKASKCLEDVLVLERVIRLLTESSCSATLTMYQAFKIFTHIIIDYPSSKTALEYLESLAEIIEQILHSHIDDTDDPVFGISINYFINQVKMLCVQTLEELSFDDDDTTKIRYRARSSKTEEKKFNLMSIGQIEVRVRPGDVVLLKRLNHKSKEPISTIRAVVISIESGVRIEVSWVPRDIEIATWKLILVGNIIGFRNSMNAIQELYPTQEDKISTFLKIIFEPEKFTKNNTDLLVASNSDSQELNASQHLAVERAQNGPLTLWQGPAGTGKTKSIFQLILRLLGHNFDKPILVTAATNAAVDNVALHLVNHGGINLVRIGDIKAIHSNLLSITLEIGLDGLPKRKHSKDAKQKLQDAKVIFATCVGCGISLLEKFEFCFVIVDEASQVSEPTCLIPLAKKCERFLLVGDHKQLPPFYLPKAKEVGYSISLFERMIKNSYPCYLLDTQYRMHPGISEFPNKKFYNNKLKDGVNAEQRPLINGFAWPNPVIPVAFVQITGKELYLKSSKYNSEEVNDLVNKMKIIIESGDVGPQEIGIISLYNAQLEKVDTAIKDCKNESFKNIEIKTADGFQGREKELILITCVRCNENGNIGFLDDERRFNVMLTRAKRGLIIFGDRKTLCSSQMWIEWFAWADQNELVIKE